MKLARLVSTSALCCFLGTSALIYAQEQRDDAKPAQDDSRPEATKPARDDAKSPRQQDAQPQKQDEDKNRDRDNDKAVKPEDNKAAPQAEHARPSNDQAQHAAGRIPDDKFRANFGRQHTFVINHPTIVEGQPRFQYGGFWFNITDAWPVGWAYTDQCYVDYIDGEYFLFDLAHPGVRIALVVVL
jgi:hypothetical protein